MATKYARSFLFYFNMYYLLLRSFIVYVNKRSNVCLEVVTYLLHQFAHSLVPRPIPFFVLRFAFRIIHGIFHFRVLY